MLLCLLIYTMRHFDLLLTIPTYIAWFKSRFPHMELDSFGFTQQLSAREMDLCVCIFQMPGFLSLSMISSLVFWGRPSPLMPGSLVALHLLIQPLLHSTWPNQHRRLVLSRFSGAVTLNFSSSTCLLLVRLDVEHSVEHGSVVSL